MKTEDYIADITQWEWAMFQAVNEGHDKASCQNDSTTFFIMRESQFQTWDKESLAAYRQDLMDAKAQDRNLLTEKYAYMMVRADPQLQQSFSRILPEVSLEKKILIRQICQLHLEWDRQCREMYPLMTRGTRPMEMSMERNGVVSTQRYLEGELCTYSEATLQACLRHAIAAKEAGRNLCEEILDHTMEHYGFGSAAEYEGFVRASVL